MVNPAAECIGPGRRELGLAAGAALVAMHSSMTLVQAKARPVSLLRVYPGVGRRLVDAVQARDVPVIQGAGIAIALLVTTANSVADAVALTLGGIR